MVSLSALWLPILLSAVIVFVASSIMHAVLTTIKATASKFPMRPTFSPPSARLACSGATITSLLARTRK